MKRFLLYLIPLVCLFAACEKIDETVAVTGITLDKPTLSLVEGDEATLTATVSPSDATDKTVTWSTSAADIATVANGKVTAVKAGEATITAKAGDKTATCKVTVAAKVIPVTGITLEPATLSLVAGDEATLTATVSPADATDKTVIWSTSAADIATVTNGKVTAVKAGEATITATAGDKSATCKVTVKEKVIPVTGVVVDNWTISLLLGETAQISYTVQPADATDKSVTFESSNPAVATVSSTGLVKAVGAGNARITVTTTDGGFSHGCTVKVSDQVSLFEVDGIAYKYVNYHNVEVTSREARYSGTINIPAKVTYQDIEYSVVSVGIRAFQDCPDLIAVTLPEGLKTIEARAFTSCPLLESIILPTTLIAIDNGNPVFQWCPKLEISVAENSKNWFVNDHALYRKSLNDIYLTWLPEKYTGVFTVMDGTTIIYQYSLYNTSIDRIVIPKTVKGIYARFFCGACKTPLVIDLNWTTKEEVDAISTNDPSPERFYFNGTDRSKVTVTVPKGTKALYEYHWLWSVLGGITERE